MSTQGQPLPSLADAITAVETAETNTAGAVAQTTTDQNAAAALQTKLTAAQGVVAQDLTAQQSVQSAEVEALQTLDLVIQARIVALTPPLPASS